MQGRILSKPIEENKFKSLCDFLLRHLPNQITIAGEPVNISSIQFISTFAGSGLVDDKKRPIFVQIYNPPPSLRYFTQWLGVRPEFLSAIPYEQFRQLLEPFPSDWQCVYLRCLNPNPQDLGVYRNIENDITQQTHQTEAQALKVIPSPLNNITVLSLLDHNIGLFYLHSHYHLESWLYLCDSMPEFASKKVGVLYLEMAKIAMGPLFSEFNRTGDEAFLKEHLDMYNLDLHEIVPLIFLLAVSAKRNGITVIPVDSSSTRPEDHTTLDKLFASNKRRDSLIAANISISQRDNNNPKFIALYGALHAPVAKKLNVPAIVLLSDGKAVNMNAKRTGSENPDPPLEHLEDYDLTLKIPSRRPKKACCSLIRFGIFSVAAVAVCGTVVKLLHSSYEVSDQNQQGSINPKKL